MVDLFPPHQWQSTLNIRYRTTLFFSDSPSARSSVGLSRHNLRKVLQVLALLHLYLLHHLLLSSSSFADDVLIVIGTLVVAVSYTLATCAACAAYAACAACH